MGFVVSAFILASAIMVTQVGFVGQTAAEGALLFPKEQIRDVRALVGSLPPEDSDNSGIREDVRILALARWNAVVDYRVDASRSTSQGYGIRRVSLFYEDGSVTCEEVLNVAADS